MARNELSESTLGAGEYYGQVPRKKGTSSTIISEVVHQCGRDLPEHSHELAFFSLLLDGNYYEAIGQKAYYHRPMTIWWRPSEITHKDCIGENGCRFFNVEIRSSGLELLKEHSKIPADFCEQNTPLVWLSWRLYQEFLNWDVGSNLVAEGLTLEMLAHATRKELKRQEAPTKWLGRVIERLNDDFTNAPTTEQLAVEAGVHPVHLSAAFRKFQGKTIGEYLRDLRVRYASEMLTCSDLSLAEIAVLAGFSDQSHFTRTFKRFTGITPGVFRKDILSH